MENVMRSAFIALIAIALEVGSAWSQPSGLPHMIDSVSAVQGAGRYIVGSYGTDFILNPGIKCGSVRECRAEQNSGVTKALGDARRGIFLAALQGVIANVRVATRAEALGCDDVAHVCRVRGAARYFEVREPTFANDTATLRVRYYESEGRFLRQQVDVIHLVKGQGSAWVVVGREALGYHAK